MDKCYIAQGGRELVIGGKLTILPGAEIEGLPAGGIDLSGIEMSKATTVAALRDDLNALIMALKGMKPEEEAPEAEEAEEE